MYLVYGSLTSGASRISCTPTGSRRQAWSASAPLLKAFSATRASASGVMPCSCM